MSFASADATLLKEMTGCTPVVTAGYLARSKRCVRLIELDGRISVISTNGMAALAIRDPAEVLDRYWWELWPEDMIPVLRNAVTRGRLGETCEFQGPCATAIGEVKSWRVVVTPVRDRRGTIRRLLVVSDEADAS